MDSFVLKLELGEVIALQPWLLERGLIVYGGTLVSSQMHFAKV